MPIPWLNRRRLLILRPLYCATAVSHSPERCRAAQIPIHSQRLSREGGCRKKQKSVEPQRHQGTKEAFFVSRAWPELARKKLCVSVSLWFPSFQGFLRQPRRRGSGCHCVQGLCGTPKISLQQCFGCASCGHHDSITESSLYTCRA